MINVILGCKKSDTGHININAGIFGILEESLKITNKRIIPAKENTDCPNRRSSVCNIDCPSAITGYQAGHSISFLQLGKRI